MHEMGPALADSHATFAEDASVLAQLNGAFPSFNASQFMTTPLWGVAVTAPYLHDGRAPTIYDAVDAHGGDAAQSAALFRDASAEDQKAILDFLGTLTWRQAPLP